MVALQALGITEDNFACSIVVVAHPRDVSGWKSENEMKAQFLAERDEGRAFCILCSADLGEYVRSLPDTYQDYDIQRQIVSNVYLDRLVDTILIKGHIPVITLVADKADVHRQGDAINIRDFRILDGLQRTFRLEAIYQTINFCLQNLDSGGEDYASWSRYRLSRSFSAELAKFNSNTEILRKILRALNKVGGNKLRDCFSNNLQWFEVWIGLTPDEEVRKMLTLNAGHKPVQIRHQLELLFRYLLPTFDTTETHGFELVREKEIRSAQFSKKRSVGHFHFAHIVTSLLSLYAKEPITPSSALIQDIQTKELDLDHFNDLTNARFLGRFVSFLVRIDRLLQKQYGSLGTLWMGREVALAGLFAALGKYAHEVDEQEYDVFRRFERIIADNPGILNLKQYEGARNNLDLSKVNIGSVNRSAIYEATYDLVRSDKPKQIEWVPYFGGRAR